MRDSKNILYSNLGVTPMQRQYGGGLDDAYMNRRSAFAAPDANSAFASPMGQSGLPTIYRQEGGDIPITSVNGQGIHRIIYRESGGGMGYEGAAQDYADAYGPTDPGNVDPNEGLYDSTPELAFGAGQYVPPQKGDPAQVSNEQLGYINPPPTPFRSTNPNYLRYEAQQKMNREIQSPEKGIGGRTPQEMTAGAGVPGFRTSYPSQDIINADINSMKRAAQNKLNEERKEKANKPDQTTAVSLYLYNVAKHGETFGATNLPPSTLYKAAETPTGVMNLLAAIARGDYGTRAKSLEVPQELINTANQERANQSYGIAPPQEFNRKTGGGLPTIYRDVGGGVGDNYAAAAEEYADMAAEEEASYFGDGLGDVGDDGRLPGGSPATAPQGGTVGSDVDFNTSSFPTDPNAGVFGTPLQTFAQIKGRLDGNRPEDGYNEVEYTYLNDIMAKTGMPITEAENYLASMMATPGGIAAMEKGFYGDYTGGGPAGTLDNFARGLGDNLGVQGIFDRDKKNKEEEDLLRDQAQGIEPSIFNSIKDIVNRYFKGNKGLETEKGKQEFKDALKSEGATFEPIEESMMQSAFGVANTLANPISGLSSVLEFITGATPKGTVITKEGVRFALDATGALTPEAFLMNPEVDYGNKATSKQRGRPVEKKITETVTKEEEESTPKKSIDSVAMKASNINKLKSYMNLTGKNLSTSKKDLAITDISITEEDFT